MLGDSLLLYIGSAPTRVVGKRVNAEWTRPAEKSQPKEHLGVLIAAALGVELRRTRLRSGVFRDFRPHQPLLTWMCSNTWFSCVELNGRSRKEILLLEEALIRRMKPLLNLRHNDSHPFYDSLVELLRVHRSRCDELPIVEGK
jgi:hypothetical protein